MLDGYFSRAIESLNPGYAIPAVILALENNMTKEYLIQAANTTIQTVMPVVTEVARQPTRPELGAITALLGLGAVAFLVARRP